MKITLALWLGASVNMYTAYWRKTLEKMMEAQRMAIRQTRMEISLETYRRNYRAIREHVKNSRVMAVVKADAYGMGAVPVARLLKKEGADLFAVATPDEAIELREAEIDDPILILGASPYEAADTCVRLNLGVTVTDLKMAEALSAAAQRQNHPALVHLKIDSGMGRLGFSPADATKAAEQIHRLPGIRFDGIFTHFATSDEEDLSFTREQFRIFSSVTKSVRRAGISTGMVHCCNSGALMAGLSEMFCDAVRPGHILHGIMPSKDCGHAIHIMPCFEIKTAIAAIRELPPGSGISYGRTYTTQGPERIAVLPIGYADGFNRRLSNGADVLIHGKRCPLRGRICMDQCAVDISHINGAEVGDEVVLIGRQGDETIYMEEIADKLSTNTATIPLSFTSRVPRIYI
jgi:alanine racemase